MKNNIQYNYLSENDSLSEGEFRYCFLFKTLLLLIPLLFNQTIQAASIVLDAPDRISAGQNFEVNIGISGLDSAVDLGAFSFDFFFTKDITSFLPSTSSFGGELGSSIDTLVGVDISDVGINLTKLEIFEVSLLLDLSSQIDDFTLFTVGLFTPRFSGSANKLLGVTANNFVLSDALGNVITASNTTVGKGIIITPSSVPEPSTLLLIVLGLSGIRILTWKNTLRNICL